MQDGLNLLILHMFKAHFRTMRHKSFLRLTSVEVTYLIFHMTVLTGLEIHMSNVSGTWSYVIQEQQGPCCWYRTYHQKILYYGKTKHIKKGIFRLFKKHEKSLYLCYMIADSLTYTHTVTRLILNVPSLTVTTLGKIFSRRYFEILSLIFPRNRIWHFMQIVSRRQFA